MLRVLHFADAHIDIANYGRHDPETGLPVRVVDFLHSLDQIVDRAIREKVDLVIFAGDAYKDRNPQPTFQRAWGERMICLSEAGIPTILLVGNHDVAPAAGRAHTVQEFKTLRVPHIHVADKIELLGPEELGRPLQIITVPWVSRSALMTREETAGKSLDEIMTIIESRINDAIRELIDQADPDLPTILTAHASVQGARYGSERAVMLGHELTLSGSVIADPRLDYVALGHIHRHQCLNGSHHPPIVYAGSIERIDFGEAREEKGFVLAEVSRGRTTWQFMPLKTRRFVDLEVDTPSADTFMADVLRQLPDADDVDGLICRVRLSYPRDWEPLVDEAAIGERFKKALIFQLQKHRHSSNRARLGDTIAVEALGPEELLAQYWQTIGLDEEEAAAMQKLAKTIFTDLS
ncbi:MAG: exonuclease SbcCD subunit D [Chloroflexi bacterium]|nr:exonuclease SbcCD subunit D [Chloroflexota bacterium]MCI0576559.1 exonuclease SbcCD subunit D [Chloroflexota bacterium]MCI0643810.1 exonuclease SbcCD subunit D [Chloroflexota bacterium]MCI0726092.1 exonuclease SbcCD subunit D [Chloroflexota bacterium]